MSTNAVLFGLESRPPLGALLVLGLQHAALALVFLVYPLAVAQELNLAPAATLALLMACVFGMAVGTCLHFFRPPWGSGSLAVEIPTPLFLPTAMLAGGSGGVGAIAAVSLLSGVTGVVFSRLLRHLRAWFPAEVCGIAVLMLGVSIIRPGMLNSFGVTDSSDILQAPALLVSTATLATIVAIAIFGPPRIKLLALFGGLLVGALLSTYCGYLGRADWAAVVAAPWFAWPELSLAAPRLEWSLVPLALVMGIAQSVDNLGMLVGIQRQIDQQWQKLDLPQASGGLRVSGIGDLAAGLFGGMPTGISSASVGLAHATGAISRVVALVAGCALLLALFIPKIIMALSLVPKPVVGAVVVYAAVYMVVSGMSLILNRVLSERRIFVIGFSVVLGLTSALLPGVYRGTPEILQPILESPLAVSTLTAIVLTQLFRVGAALRTSFEMELSDSRNESVQEMQVNRSLRQSLEGLGAEVGAARQFIDRAIDVTSELIAAMRVADCVDGPLHLAARFEDSRLEIVLRYQGRPLTHLPTVRHVDRISASKHEGDQVVVLVYQG